MRKASEYRKHADECRELARRMDSSEHREQLLEMARHWERMEQERIAFIGSYPEFAVEPRGDSDDDEASALHS